MRREFRFKLLNLLHDWAPKSAAEGRIQQNSLFFSLLAGNYEQIQLTSKLKGSHYGPPRLRALRDDGLTARRNGVSAATRNNDPETFGEALGKIDPCVVLPP
jgi:hypothetical protein